MVTKAEVCTKIPVARRDALKSKLFTTINGVFCRFCANQKRVIIHSTPLFGGV